MIMESPETSRSSLLLSQRQRFRQRYLGEVQPVGNVRRPSLGL